MLTQNRKQTPCEFLTCLIIASIIKEEAEKHPSVLSICKDIIIISVSKGLKSCWGDHVDPPEAPSALQSDAHALGLESGNLILQPIIDRTVEKSLRLWASVCPSVMWEE